MPKIWLRRLVWMNTLNTAHRRLLTPTTRLVGGCRKCSEMHTQTSAKWRWIICQSLACQLNPNGSFQVPKSPLQTDETVLEVIYLKLYSVYGRGCISGIKRLTYWQDWMVRKATARGRRQGEMTSKK